MPNPVTGIASVIGSVVGKIGGVLDSISTTDEERLAAKAELAKIASEAQIRLAEVDAKFAEERAKVLVAEAQSESWLTRNWRPITALSFVGIVVYNMVVAPMFSLTTIAIVTDLWDVIKICLGGYVFGRTAENVASWAPDVVTAWRGNSSMPLADVGNANK